MGWRNLVLSALARAEGDMKELREAWDSGKYLSDTIVCATNAISHLSEVIGYTAEMCVPQPWAPEDTKKEESAMGKGEPTLKPVTVVISGEHDSGKTTLANLIRMCLEESGYKHVSLRDVEPLPYEEKDRFPERFARNRTLRAVDIRVVLTEEV